MVLFPKKNSWLTLIERTYLSLKDSETEDGIYNINLYANILIKKCNSTYRRLYKTHVPLNNTNK